MNMNSTQKIITYNKAATHVAFSVPCLEMMFNHLQTEKSSVIVATKENQPIILSSCKSFS